MFDWFNAKDAIQFGEAIATFIAEKIPLNTKNNTIKSDYKNTLIILDNRIESFKRKSSINFYKKAKLGNAFKWKLIDMGYDEAWVNELTRELLIRL
ncbi:MAG: hypothetical protein V4525_16925 [Pseudomonadota bacterium]